jgi:vacuolar-type H+-ATPase subunit H
MLRHAACGAQERPSQRVFLCLVARPSPVLDTERFRRPVVCRKEVELEPSRDPILQDLIDHEKSVAVRVEEARAEAERIVAQSRSEARDTAERARRDGEAIVRESAELARRQAEEARAAILAAAEAQVAAIEGQATARRDAAVQVVVERVLP